MQVNSLRGPTAPQASLAHHLTAIPNEGLRTNELVKQMSEQAREGAVEGWRDGRLRMVHTAAAAPALDLPACLHPSSISAPHLSNSLSLCFSVREPSVTVSISVCLFPSPSFTAPLFYWRKAYF